MLLDSIRDIRLIKDIVQMGFQLTIAIVTCLGLWKWQVELRGKVEYDAAKQALVNAYTIRDQIKSIQRGFVFPSEWADYESAEGEGESDTQRDASRLYFVYSRRFSKLQDGVFNQFYPVIVEAEAVFGSEGREKLENLLDMTRRLRVAIEMYHRNLYNHSSDPKLAQLNKKHFNIINGLHGLEDLGDGSGEELIDDDNFQENLDAAIQEIQEYFVPKLGRKHPSL